MKKGLIIVLVFICIYSTACAPSTDDQIEKFRDRIDSLELPERADRQLVQPADLAEFGISVYDVYQKPQTFEIIPDFDLSEDDSATFEGGILFDRYGPAGPRIEFKVTPTQYGDFIVGDSIISGDVNIRFPDDAASPSVLTMDGIVNADNLYAASGEGKINDMDASYRMEGKLGVPFFYGELTIESDAGTETHNILAGSVDSNDDGISDLEDRILELKQELDASNTPGFGEPLPEDEGLPELAPLDCPYSGQFIKDFNAKYDRPPDFMRQDCETNCHCWQGIDDVRLGIACEARVPSVRLCNPETYTCGYRPYRKTQIPTGAGTAAQVAPAITDEQVQCTRNCLSSDPLNCVGGAKTNVHSIYLNSQIPAGPQDESIYDTDDDALEDESLFDTDDESVDSETLP
jgi:hypothetical protein